VATLLTCLRDQEGREKRYGASNGGETVHQQRGLRGPILVIFHLPFLVQLLRSNNGSEFAVDEVKRFCDATGIRFTRSRACVLSCPRSLQHYRTVNHPLQPYVSQSPTASAPCEGASAYTMN
jgi:hypothetical protein